MHNENITYNRVLMNSKNSVRSTLGPIDLKLSQIVASTLGNRPSEFGESGTNITETVISLCIVGLSWDSSGK
ncbi:unnamed protein product [Macrosiphum euphorbiae]|uniref:Uncharacterized protein n=1 Tax=Macrosiphum euphorbiae TaxID=13131 RepID=A0AAV0WVI3_9HEMI|nr:unnamed protein product [Macrosiphum euphorbiae]